VTKIAVLPPQGPNSISLGTQYVLKSECKNKIMNLASKRTSHKNVVSNRMENCGNSCNSLLPHWLSTTPPYSTLGSANPVNLPLRCCQEFQPGFIEEGPTLLHNIVLHIFHSFGIHAIEPQSLSSRALCVLSLGLNVGLVGCQDRSFTLPRARCSWWQRWERCIPPSYFAWRTPFFGFMGGGSGKCRHGGTIRGRFECPTLGRLWDLVRTKRVLKIDRFCKLNGRQNTHARA